jgi:predicted protein tyrosine phosphatase
MTTRPHLVGSPEIYSDVRHVSWVTMDILSLISVCSLKKAKRLKRRFDAVITIEDPRQRGRLRFHETPIPAHLALRFDDIEGETTDHVLVTGAQLQEVFAFVDSINWPHSKRKLLIRCNAGVSRSTAIALTILARYFGERNEFHAGKILVDLAPDTIPNFKVIELGEALLDIPGKLRELIEKHEKNDIWAQSRRA